MWRLCQSRDILADKLTCNFLFHLDYDFEMPNSPRLTCGLNFAIQRFGLDGEDPKTLREIGDGTGCGSHGRMETSAPGEAVCGRLKAQHFWRLKGSFSQER